MAGLMRIECAASARGIWAKRGLPMWGFPFGKPGPWMMAEHFYTSETRDPELRKRKKFNRLPRQVAYATPRAPAFARILANIDPEAITSPGALARLPVTLKSELIRLRSANRPFGGLASVRRGGAVRVFASPGPIFKPEGRCAYYTSAECGETAPWRRDEEGWPRLTDTSRWAGWDRPPPPTLAFFSRAVAAGAVVNDAAAGSVP